MNSTIKRIKELETQITTLKRIQGKGEHLAAGLTVTLGVGPDPERTTTLEVAWWSEDVLECLVRSLETSLKYRKQDLEAEYEEIKQHMEVPNDQTPH